MLKCISCGHGLPETFNTIACPKCSNDEIHNWLYSTNLKSFAFPASPFSSTVRDRQKGLANQDFVWLKREDKNPLSGTFKDRKTALLTQYHPSPCNRTFTLASSGNMAISFSKIWSSNKKRYIDTYLWVSPYIDLKKLRTLCECYTKINFTEKILSTAELTMGEADRWNITNGMDPIGASAYYSLGLELEPYNFDNIIVPCGSGELYSALAVYFQLLRKRMYPRIIPVTSNLPEADAIKTSFVASQPFIDFFEKYYNDSFEGIEIIDDAEKLKYYSNIYNCEYSSAVVFAAYEQLKPAGRTCLIVTGAKR